MKLIPTLLSLGLSACGTGTGDMTPALTEDDVIPSFDLWSRYPTASDSCVSVGIEEPMQCVSRFPADDRNCPSAVFKFVVVKRGYMYVQTKLNVSIAAKEFHVLNFDETPEVFRLTDPFTESYHHYFQCGSI